MLGHRDSEVNGLRELALVHPVRVRDDLLQFSLLGCGLKAHRRTQLEMGSKDRC
jgi:hypothetical protein